MLLEKYEDGIRFEKYTVKDDDGGELGFFEIEDYPNDLSSIHTHIFKEHRHKGFGRQMYDEAEKLLSERGRKMVPSHNLSKDSLKIWKARSPELLDNYTIHKGELFAWRRTSYYCTNSF